MANDRPCEGPGCDRMAGTSGLCRSHYKQRHLGKDLTPLLVATKDLGRPKVCVFPDCGRPHKARGYCKGHHDHIKAGRDPVPLRGRRRPGEPPKPCAAEVCQRDAIANGYCAKHNMSRVRRWQLYGITPDAGEAMYQAQGRACAICGDPTEIDVMHVDHDHTCCPARPCCGRCVRGLLCGSCNIGIGYFKDDPDRLAAAIAYLGSVPAKYGRDQRHGSHH